MGVKRDGPLESSALMRLIGMRRLLSLTFPKGIPVLRSGNFPDHLCHSDAGRRTRHIRAPDRLFGSGFGLPEGFHVNSAYTLIPDFPGDCMI